MKNYLKFISSLLCISLVQASFGESLWLKPSTDERGLYGRNTASRVGDILSLRISESTNVAATGTQMSNAGKSSALLDEVVSVIEASGYTSFDFGKDSTSSLVDLNLANLLSGTYDGGEASLANEMSINSYVLSVQVVDVLPNGNLILEGTKIINLQGERLYVLVTGQARPTDVDNDNILNSSRLANASIEIFGEGNLSDVQKKGWLTRFIDKVNPF